MEADMETLFKDLASPHALSQIVVVLLAIFARDVVVSLLRSFAKKAKEDKDPGNDAAGEAAGALANSIEKVTLKKP
jgi:hypothetical protein